MTANIPHRGPFQGVLQILRFNWPSYALSASVLIAAPAVLKLFTGRRRRSWVRLGWMGWGGVAWWTIASLVASHWVYDRSPLMRWHWAPPLLLKPPARWVNIHSGLDESTVALRALFPESTGVAFDIFDDGEMSESSIRRARQRPSAVASTSVDHAALPLPDGSADAVFLFFAAHELRAPASRERFFREVARILSPGGRVILAEHLRDAANLAVFGPGFWHFLPRGEWLRVANRSGLRIARELEITPLVHVWSMEKSPRNRG